MLDIKRIRDNFEEVKAGVEKRGKGDFGIDRVRELDIKRREMLAEVEALKKQGINTLCPDYPQPKWFYDMCDKAGLYVIDCANISSPTECDNRAVGGTPANEPMLVEEYLERVKAMYYRSRNHTCIVGFALSGCDSGNGYNMYKAYQWLKSVEKRLPVYYKGANGEWNSDK